MKLSHRSHQSSGVARTIRSNLSRQEDCLSKQATAPPIIRICKYPREFGNISWSDLRGFAVSSGA